MSYLACASHFLVAVYRDEKFKIIFIKFSDLIKYNLIFRSDCQCIQISSYILRNTLLDLNVYKNSICRKACYKKLYKIIHLIFIFILFNIKGLSFLKILS